MTDSFEHLLRRDEVVLRTDDGVVLMVALTDLVGDDRNPRDNVHAVPRIEASIKRFGFAAIPTARPNRNHDPSSDDPRKRARFVLVAGHTRVAAAAAAGRERVPVHVLEYDEIEGRAYMVGDNRTGEVARWRDDALVELLGELRDSYGGGDLDLGLGEVDDALGAFGGMGFEADDLFGPGGLLASLPSLDPDPDPDPDPTPLDDTTVILVEPPAAPDSVPGGVYGLGRRADGSPLHVLVCGDSLDEGALLVLAALVDANAAALVGDGFARARAADDDALLVSAREALAALDKLPADLVFEDPPFAIFGSSTGVQSSISDDRMVQPFFRGVLRAALGAVPLFGQVYVCCDWRSWPALHAATKGTPGGSALVPKNLLVWDKGKSGTGSNWANTHELLGYFVHCDTKRTIMEHNQTGLTGVSGSNVLRYPRPYGDDRHHNAAKPIPLIREVIARSREGRERAAVRAADGRHVGARELRVVLDGFGGSGQTLFAAHAEGARCGMVEIEPAWCDVIRARWTAFARAQGIDPGPGALDLEGYTAEAEAAA